MGVAKHIGIDATGREEDNELMNEDNSSIFFF